MTDNDLLKPGTGVEGPKEPEGLWQPLQPPCLGLFCQAEWAAEERKNPGVFTGGLSVNV